MRVKSAYFDKINGVYDLSLLKDMLKSGEITYAEYEEMREDILAREYWEYIGRKRHGKNDNDEYEDNYFDDNYYEDMN